MYKLLKGQARFGVVIQGYLRSASRRLKLSERVQKGGARERRVLPGDDVVVLLYV